MTGVSSGPILSTETLAHQKKQDDIRSRHNNDRRRCALSVVLVHAGIAFHKPADFAAPDSHMRTVMTLRAAPCQEIAVCGLDDRELVIATGICHS